MAAGFVLVLLAGCGFAAVHGSAIALPATDAPGYAVRIELAPDHGYAVRFALPDARPGSPAPVEPSALAAPLEVLAQAPLAAEPAEQSPPPKELAAAAATPLAAVIAKVPARARMAGVIPLSYNLAGGADAKEAIEVEKPVVVAGADGGRIRLRIDGNAHVFALGSRLAEIIAKQSGEAAVPQGLERDYVSLDRLRALGIAVRYDAIRDRLVVDPPA